MSNIVNIFFNIVISCILMSFFPAISFSGDSDIDGFTFIEIQEEYRAVLKENTDLKYQIDFLENIESRVDKALDSLNRTYISEMTVSSLCRNILDILKKISDNTTSQDDRKKLLKDLSENMAKYENHIYKAYKSVKKILNTSMRDVSNNLRSKMHRLTSFQIDDSVSENFLPEWTSSLKTMFRYAFYAGRPVIHTDDDLHVMLDTISNDNTKEKYFTIDYINKSIKLLKNQLTQKLQNINYRLNQEKQELEKKIDSNEYKKKELLQSMKLQNEQKKTIDQGLVYAIYLMIIVLVSLFLIIKFIPSDVANAMIQKRSIVEVVSMAFMLITIIILGTGDRIGKETLGTLLGTIAGYIFGRRSSDNKVI